MGPFSKTLSCFAAILLVSSFASCGSSPSGGSPSSGIRVVTDVWGREVEIPAEVSSIVCLGSGAPRMAAYLEAVDMLAGVEEHDAEAVTVLRDYSPVYQSQIKGCQSCYAAKSHSCGGRRRERGQQRLSGRADQGHA